MFDPYLAGSHQATPIELVTRDEFDQWRSEQPEGSQRAVVRQRFRAEPEQHCWLTDPDRVAAGWDGTSSLASLGNLPLTLAEGNYRMAHQVDELQLLGWGVGCYQFARYKNQSRTPARLVLPGNARRERLGNLVAAVTLVRDLINTPAGDMSPAHLAAEVGQVADSHNAHVRTITGDELLKAGYRTIHAVGRAAVDPPRLVDVHWGEANRPLIVVVGKGVCFDSGGLDIKTAAGMRIMKKDMGGAAAALGLAQLVMAENLPVRLRLLIPAVENAIAGNAYRPGDILHTYSGLTVEVDNTDAEGRLILCDALALAAEQQPQLIVDFATLTGAARVAVGTEVSAMFCNDATVASAIATAGKAVDDPVWPLPLHEGYGHLLDSRVADTLNSASSPYAGAITAALFLQKFVGTIPWAHFDIMGYNVRKRPGRPVGGEAMAMRAVFQYLQERYGP